MVIKFILDILFPSKCGICGKLGENICENCFNELKQFEITKQYKDVFFVYRYEGKIRKLILSYKFKDSSYLYKTFSDCLLKNKNLCNFLKSYDIITSVPLHKRRKAERGYNQSDLIAKDLSKSINNLHKTNKLNSKEKYFYDKSIELKYYNDILIKNLNTKPQSSKQIKDRQKDVIGIYEVKNSDLVKDKNVAIFDDIYTTGSTLNECKKVLLNAGAKKVGIIALAKDYIN